MLENLIKLKSRDSWDLMLNSIALYAGGRAIESLVDYTVSGTEAHFHAALTRSAVAFLSEAAVYARRNMIHSLPEKTREDLDYQNHVSRIERARLYPMPEDVVRRTKIIQDQASQAARSKNYPIPRGIVVDA